MNAAEAMDMDDLLYDLEGLSDYLRDEYYEHGMADHIDGMSKTIAELIQRVKNHV